MGTRNLTAVRLGGRIVATKYCQWDGYLSSACVKLLEALAGADLNVLSANAGTSAFIDQEQLLKLWKDEGANDTGWVDMEVAQRFTAKYPLLSRDPAGAYLIEMLKLGPVVTYNDFDFGRDSLFCEFAYLVDLDMGTFEIYRGFNKESVPEGNPWFTTEPPESKGVNGQPFYPVRLLKRYPLNALPTPEAMLEELEKRDDEEDDPSDNH